jgi:hypothetical protein
VVGITLEEQTDILEKFTFRQEQAELEMGEDYVMYLSFSDFDVGLVRNAETNDLEVRSIPPIRCLGLDCSQYEELESVGESRPAFTTLLPLKSVSAKY